MFTRPVRTAPSFLLLLLCTYKCFALYLLTLSTLKLVSVTNSLVISLEEVICTYPWLTEINYIVQLFAIHFCLRKHYPTQHSVCFAVSICIRLSCFPFCYYFRYRVAAGSATILIPFPLILCAFASVKMLCIVIAHTVGTEPSVRY